MKKLIIFCVTLSIAAISGAVVLKGLQERQWMNPELVANEQALAAYADDALGTCGVLYNDIDYGLSAVCGISKTDALYIFDICGVNWCCDSCPSTWYCG